MHKKSTQPGEKGFILPLSVMLMFVLVISGMNFLQFDFLENRLTRNELDNQAAFYLASTGIERSLEAFKLPPSATWTIYLKDSSKNDASSLGT